MKMITPKRKVFKLSNATRTETFEKTGAQRLTTIPITIPLIKKFERNFPSFLFINFKIKGIMNYEIQMMITDVKIIGVMLMLNLH